MYDGISVKVFVFSSLPLILSATLCLYVWPTLRHHKYIKLQIALVTSVDSHHSVNGENCTQPSAHRASHIQTVAYLQCEKGKMGTLIREEDALLYFYPLHKVHSTLFLSCALSLSLSLATITAESCCFLLTLFFCYDTS